MNKISRTGRSSRQLHGKGRSKQVALHSQSIEKEGMLVGVREGDEILLLISGLAQMASFTEKACYLSSLFQCFTLFVWKNTENN